MAWTNSKVFVSTAEDVWENTTAMDLLVGTWKVALFDTTPTPSQTVASAATAYATGVWVTTDEVADGTNWDAGGEPLTGQTFTPASNVLTLDATDTPQGGASTTLAGVFGCLVYDDALTTPVANQGLSYHYFGGSQGVTSGTFSVVWHANGLMTITL